MVKTTASSGGDGRIWAVRIAVLLAFAVALIGFGPRALAVLQSRAAAAERNSPRVLLDHVGFTARPEWLSGSLLARVARDLQPYLHGEVAILDEAAALALRDALQQVPWVAEARIEREFPDRFRVRFGLRRPVLEVQDEQGLPLCLVDREAVVLPHVGGLAVPRTVLRRAGGAPSMRASFGQPAPDDRVVAAAAIAVEWRDELAPLVPGCPPLLEIDTTNLGERYVRRDDYPEVRVVLQRADGAPVVFGYGRAVGSPRPGVPVATKARVLAAILGEFPGLQGLVAGDLRFPVRWRSWLRPRQGA